MESKYQTSSKPRIQVFIVVVVVTSMYGQRVTSAKSKTMACRAEQSRAEQDEMREESAGTQKQVACAGDCLLSLLLVARCPSVDL